MRDKAAKLDVDLLLIDTGVGTLVDASGPHAYELF